MHQILDSHKEEQIVPLFRLGFRPFFLLGALFSCLAMLGWLGQLNNWFALPGIGNPSGGTLMRCCSALAPP